MTLGLRILENSPVEKTEQIVEQVRLLVYAGELLPKERLPSPKELAKELSVNRNTVSAAYKQLMADGVLEGRLGSGTYVAAKPCLRMEHALTLLIARDVVTRLRAYDLDVAAMLRLLSAQASLDRAVKPRVAVAVVARKSERARELAGELRPLLDAAYTLEPLSLKEYRAGKRDHAFVLTDPQLLARKPSDDPPGQAKQP